jgi:choline dehydrogenase-like flavoprotein
MTNLKVMIYDLIVVGTGFASSFFLKKFLEKAEANAKVLVLERGMFEPQRDRIARAKQSPYGFVNYVTNTPKGTTYFNPNPDKPWIFDPSFGGSSNCWTGCTPRFMPSDFELKSKYGVGMDWPLSYDELEPYYCEAEDIMAISGPALTPYPMSKSYPLPPHKLNSVDKILNGQYNELYISQPTARASKPGNRSACCSSSICHLCPVGAKFTIENGLLPIYQDPRVTVQYNTQVVSLDIEGGKVKGVVGVMEGKHERYKSEVVALGGNAIFNAHILLNSGDTNDNTGRYLSEQVGYYGYVHLHDLDNLGGSTIITANGFMLYDGAFRNESASCLIESHNDPFVRAEYGKWRKIAKFKFVFEDLPQPENRVQKSTNELIPVTEYKSHSKYVERGYARMKSELPNLLSKLPVEEILLDENYQASESHILGTTRMSTEKSKGVIDKHLIHHTYRNVFVLGGGAFPTISAANPTLTLSALSLWAASKSF